METKTKSSLYTRNGDSGTTGSFSGKKYRKDDSLIEINGVIDETISGMERVKLHLSEEANPKQYKQLNKILEALYLLGAEISAGKTTGLTKYIDKGYTEKLEEKIDDMAIKLTSFVSFTTIQGVDASEARTRVRRLERRLTSLLRRDQLRSPVYTYVNRLSDYMFTLSVYLERVFK